ncbi:MAG: hypothetical protein IPH62_19645 [Ignavibacteriae bacterium]|nr:hypothetical protein [Ignavibacteriota bacterium]
MSIANLITNSLKKKYQQDKVLNEGMTVTLENIQEIKNKILTEDIINNLGSALMMGIISNEVISESKIKRNSKKK